MYDVKYLDELNGKPEMRFALKAWADLIDTGYSGYYLPLRDDLKALVIHNNTTPIAILIFLDEPYGYFIETGWIEPFHRNKQLYSFLWDQLVKMAIQHSKDEIVSWILPDNHKMRAIAQRQGRTEEVIYHDGRKLIESTFKINRAT